MRVRRHAESHPSDTQADGRESIAGKARLVIISSIDVGDSVAQGLSMDCFFIRCVKPVCMARVFADLDRAEEACWLESLEEDGVRCVAVRPPLLKDETAPGSRPSGWLRDGAQAGEEGGDCESGRSVGNGASCRSVRLCYVGGKGCHRCRAVKGY